MKAGFMGPHRRSPTFAPLFISAAAVCGGSSPVPHREEGAAFPSIHPRQMQPPLIDPLTHLSHLTL